MLSVEIKMEIVKEVVDFLKEQIDIGEDTIQDLYLEALRRQYGSKRQLKDSLFKYIDAYDCVSDRGKKFFNYNPKQSVIANVDDNVLDDLTDYLVDSNGNSHIVISIERHVENSVFANQVVNAVLNGEHTFNDTDIEIFKMHFLYGLTISEIREELGLSLERIKHRITYIRFKLSRYYHDDINLVYLSNGYYFG